MKTVLITLFLLSGLATAQLDAQDCCPPGTPTPACCSGKKACAGKAANVGSAAVCTPEQMKNCTPEQMKNCHGSAAVAEPRTDAKMAATMQEPKPVAKAAAVKKED